jgi:hypothetical protein
MIIGLFVLFNAIQLSAQEEVGKSIFTKIETPHPYPAAMEGKTLVWSKTIDQPGAAWIKIHFSQFQLDREDYINLVDMNGNVIEQIKGKDVLKKAQSKFSVKTNFSKTVSFWGPAIEGNKVTIELHSVFPTSNREKGIGNKFDKDRIKNDNTTTKSCYTSNVKSLGFIIDEVGLGTKTLREGISIIECTCGTYNLQNIICYYGQEPYNKGQAIGRMYYNIYGYWYRSTGFLCSCNNSSTFLASSYPYLINSQSTVDTLEVQFGYQYTNCNGTGPITSTTYYGDTYIWSDSNKHYCMLTLKDNPQTTYGTLIPLNRGPILNENIYIVQHPNGDPKKIGFGNVNDTGGSGLYFSHYIDTLYGGSVGSPILTDNWDTDKVLGFDYLGNCPNYAVKMSQIYADVKKYNGCN